MSKKHTDQNVEEQADEVVTDQATPQEDVVAQLQEQLRLAQEAERRALADYQNVVRRNQEERAAFVKFAAKDVVSSLVEPLTHLDMAAKQLQDPGLNMVIEQFWAKLQDVGLEQVDVMGKKFDVSVMEAADTSGDGDTVVAVHRPAYTFNGEVIQHARVVVGKK
jgi:molecular chaperone GrpE (heat shock protein)